MRRERTALKPEINLTSMIDVMALLMVVFMVAAPLLSTGVNVNLPRGGKASLAGDKALNISIDRAGAVFIGKDKVAHSDLRPRLSGIAKANPDISIIISGDTAARYGAVAEVMAELKAMGFSRVGLKMEPTR